MRQQVETLALGIGIGIGCGCPSVGRPGEGGDLEVLVQPQLGMREQRLQVGPDARHQRGQGALAGIAVGAQQGVAQQGQDRGLAGMPGPQLGRRLMTPLRRLDLLVETDALLGGDPRVQPGDLHRQGGGASLSVGLRLLQAPDGGVDHRQRTVGCRGGQGGQLAAAVGQCLGGAPQPGGEIGGGLDGLAARLLVPSAVADGLPGAAVQLGLAQRGFRDVAVGLRCQQRGLGEADVVTGGGLGGDRGRLIGTRHGRLGRLGDPLGPQAVRQFGVEQGNLLAQALQAVGPPGPNRGIQRPLGLVEAGDQAAALEVEPLGLGEVATADRRQGTRQRSRGVARRGVQRFLVARGRQDAHAAEACDRQGGGAAEAEAMRPGRQDRRDSVVRLQQRLDLQRQLDGRGLCLQRGLVAARGECCGVQAMEPGLVDRQPSQRGGEFGRAQGGGLGGAQADASGRLRLGALGDVEPRGGATEGALGGIVILPGAVEVAASAGQRLPGGLGAGARVGLDGGELAQPARGLGELGGGRLPARVLEAGLVMDGLGKADGIVRAL